MTSPSIRHAPHRIPKTALLTIVAAAFAVLVGFAIAALALDEATVTTPPNVIVKEGPSVGPGSDAYNSTDREVRELMHRRCLDGVGC